MTTNAGENGTSAKDANYIDPNVQAEGLAKMADAQRERQQYLHDLCGGWVPGLLMAPDLSARRNVDRTLR